MKEKKIFHNSPLSRGDADRQRGYKTIPYNTNLVEKAREYRKNPTPAEKLIWEKILRNKQLLGLKFTRQKPLSKFIVDFYCSRLLLAVEIDGEYHKFTKVRDEERTKILNTFNIHVIRFENHDILTHLDKVKIDLIEMIRKREKELGLTPLIPLDRGKSKLNMKGKK